MTSQEIITYTPKIFQLISSREATEAFSDSNIRQLMQFLRTPSTVEDLENAFRKVKNEKSDKTIYRYLNKVVKAGLVVPAGKRISVDGNGQIKTQTIYARVAKVFSVSLPQEEAQKTVMNKALSIILSEGAGLPSKDISHKKIDHFVDGLILSKWELLENILEKTDNEELGEILDGLPVGQMLNLVEIASWILLLGEDLNLVDEIKKCLK